MSRFKNNKNIVTELRIISRIILETIKGLVQTGLMNWVIIGTLAAILSIFGCMFRTSLGMSTFVNELGNVLEISVYLKPGTNPEIQAEKMKYIKHVQRVNIKTRDDAWRELKRQMNVPNISNPLPDTLHVKVTKQDYMKEVIKTIKNMSSVEDIKYAQQLASQMKFINDMSNVATVVVLIILGGLTMFIISNTIQLLIQAKKQEIEIMRLMGVNNWYIKAPYLLQGALYGLVGALISILPLNILHSYLDKIHTYFGVPIPLMATNIVIICLMTMGIVFGAGGSFISIKKFLKV